MFKLLILVVAVLAFWSGIVPALSWVLAFLILFMAADLLRSEARRLFGRHRGA